MASRYKNRATTVNQSRSYRNIFKSRDVRKIRHFTTGTLKYPTPAQIEKLQLRNHIWKTGDHYYKLAHKYYGDSTYWWVIAIFNKKPTESDIEYGDVIYIPTPLQMTLRFMEPNT